MPADNGLDFDGVDDAQAFALSPDSAMPDVRTPRRSRRRRRRDEDDLDLATDGAQPACAAHLQFAGCAFSMALGRKEMRLCHTHTHTHTLTHTHTHTHTHTGIVDQGVVHSGQQYMLTGAVAADDKPGIMAANAEEMINMFSKDMNSGHLLSQSLAGRSGTMHSSMASSYDSLGANDVRHTLQRMCASELASTAAFCLNMLEWQAPPA